MNRFRSPDFQRDYRSWRSVSGAPQGAPSWPQPMQAQQPMQQPMQTPQTEALPPAQVGQSVPSQSAPPQGGLPVSYSSMTGGLRPPLPNVPMMVNAIGGAYNRYGGGGY